MLINNRPYISETHPTTGVMYFGLSIYNHILISLPRKESERILPHLRFVRVARGAVLHDADEPIHDVYFPNCGIILQVALLQDGSEIETAMIGNEGVAGLPAILGARSKSNFRAVAPVDGNGFLMNAAVLRDEFDQCPPIKNFMLRYINFYLNQLAQAAVCNCAHSLNQRLVCWLLAWHDRARGKEIRLTHEFIAEMLGVRRPGVTTAAVKLERQGLISCRRGRILIVDQEGLEANACECYAIVKQQFDGLHEGERRIRFQAAAA